MNIKTAIAQAIDGHDLSADEMTAVMHGIMTGGATSAQIAGFLVALRLKGESVSEIAAAAGVMRELAAGVDISGLSHTVDIVGTGGDASGTFNVSTTSMFVAAAAMGPSTATARYRLNPVVPTCWRRPAFGST